MSDDPRRRIRPSRRAGEPNVLSDAATPNTLSTGPVRRTTPPGPTPQVNESSLAPGSRATAAPSTPAARRTGLRLPSFGTVIFLGFLAITGFRLIGEFVRGLDLESPAPISTGEQPVVAGTMVFGIGSDGDCGVVGRARQFGPGTEVWWSALLSTEQSPDAEVVIIVRRDGAEISREDVPADPSFGTWSVLCSSKPIVDSSEGLYRVEVWDKGVTTLHAVGEFRRASP